MYYVYIIQSLADGTYYTGITGNLEKRLIHHNSEQFNKGITKRKSPWKYFFVLEVNNRSKALRIEKHIKRMKSRIYIQNLKKYPEIAKKLINKYS